MKLFTNVNLLLSATAVVTTAPLISAQVSSRHPIQFVCYFHLLWFWYMKNGGSFKHHHLTSLSSTSSL